MMRRRKVHRKSREGCVQCKEKHAKCNEVYPRCLQCERANLVCSFSSPTLNKPPLNEDSIADLELLEHWHRYPVTGDVTETTKQLQYNLVRLGFSHHYLLNSILGLTALQLYSEDRSQSKWEQKTACLHAVKSLFRRIAVLSDNLGDPEPGKIVWGWGLEACQTFLDLCSARHPVALVILGHFTVLMSYSQEHWCLRDWPSGLLSYIKGLLGDEWEDAMKWPGGLVFGIETLAPIGLPRLLAPASQHQPMIRAIEASNIKPVLDQQVFKLEDLKEAYQYLADQKHFCRVAAKIE
ncbi:hypothetical protein BFJ68_g17077 [Fusarium oxysporum]|uniref:Zn(2)-C6 fungal-type domain-containing protein n=1 Tax=Fusarium oxysporum TaxID=5507 RepID=A0A420P3B6_FUSOX|nr:hypothetical protein BFJ68_g17077 [Fusarium oxysporum]